MVLIFELLEIFGMVVGFLQKNTNLVVLGGFLLIYLTLLDIKEKICHD